MVATSCFAPRQVTQQHPQTKYWNLPHPSRSERENRLTMVRVKTLCGHEVRLQEPHVIAFSIKSHRHEPDEDQEVNRGRKFVKGYNNPSWIQSPEPKSTRPGARTGGWRDWAQSKVFCCFEFAFTTYMVMGLGWITHCLQAHKLTALCPKAQGQKTLADKPVLPSAQCCGHY